MTPNPKVVAAFRAMKSMGIDENTVKPVLKSLLKLYDKNWELIEEENYRVLADAIFEHQEKLTSKKERRSEVVDPDEDFEAESPVCADRRPPKRLRAGNHGCQVSAFSKSTENISDQPRLSTISQTPPTPGDLRTKVPEAQMEQLHRCIPSDPVLLLNIAAKEPQLGCIAKRSLSDEKTSSPKKRNAEHVQPDSMAKRSSSDGRGSSPRKRNVEHGVLLPRQNVVPKDEPFYDELSQVEHPVAALHPGLSDGIEGSGSDSIRKTASGTLDSYGKTGRNDEHVGIPLGCGRVIEIASSSVGEVKISLNCCFPNRESSFHLPNVDDVVKMVEDKYIEQYRGLESGFSVKGLLTDVCECMLKLGSNTGVGSKQASVDILMSQTSSMSSISSALDQHKAKITVAPSCLGQIVSMNRYSMAHLCTVPPSSANMQFPAKRNVSVPNTGPLVVSQHQFANEDIRLVHDMDDISKGEERTKISWVNNVNNEIPPWFHYISHNIVFQDARVGVSLARIAEEDCCLYCFGDCLTSLTPCQCGRKYGDDFAYRKGGLLKDEFLDEYLSVHHNCQNDKVFYCNDCPIERWRSNGVMETCKGHMMKNFIKECWSKCGCNKNCSNRAIQRGISYNLQVFFTADGRGWGLRTLDDLPKGAFVSEYVGEILTCKELFGRSVSDRNEYAVILDAQWGSYGLLRDEKALCLDPRSYGNIARFINHRCLDPNLIDIPVEVELPDHHYYHVALFTTRKVDALEELTWDYGIDFDDSDNSLRGFQCLCGSKYCRNIKRLKSRPG